MKYSSFFTPPIDTVKADFWLLQGSSQWLDCSWKKKIESNAIYNKVKKQVLSRGVWQNSYSRGERNREKPNEWERVTEMGQDKLISAYNPFCVMIIGCGSQDCFAKSWFSKTWRFWYILKIKDTSFAMNCVTERRKDLLTKNVHHNFLFLHSKNRFWFPRSIENLHFLHTVPFASFQ